jgi:NTP pyrophosphatase (non-canonical NTP hydrolase)/GNAT superfamily N-acetyltransferase
MSDKTTTVTDLREIVRKFVDERDWRQFHSPKNLSMSLAIEVAELMEHFQWLTTKASRQVGDDPAKLAAIGEELADVICYALAISNELNIDVADALRAKMIKNAVKYPAAEFRGRFGVGDKGFELTTNGIVVRRFQPADAAAVVSLFRDTIRRVNIRHYSLEQVQAWAPDEIDVEAWRTKLLGRFTVVAECDGQLVGFGDLEDAEHLGHLYVHADHQSRGIGRVLNSALEAEARRLGAQRLFTEGSITAKPFFVRLGYRVLAEQTVVCRGVEFVNYRLEKAL